MRLYVEEEKAAREKANAEVEAKKLQAPTPLRPHASWRLFWRRVVCQAERERARAEAEEAKKREEARDGNFPDSCCKAG
jgi:hypothetical protein